MFDAELMLIWPSPLPCHLGKKNDGDGSDALAFARGAAASDLPVSFFFSLSIFAFPPPLMAILPVTLCWLLMVQMATFLDHGALGRFLSALSISILAASVAGIEG